MNDHPWGRIDDDGSVFVRLPDGAEKKVGQWAAGDPTSGLAYYQRRYLDLMVEADLALKRVTAGKATPEQAESLAERLRAAVVDPSGIGDLSVFTAKAEKLGEYAAKRREAIATEKAEAKESTAKKRTEIAEEAEKLQNSQQWKATGEKYRELLEQWKQLPRFDRAAEQGLWDRFSKARSVFDKARREHFAQLDKERKEAVRVKEDLIRRAAALADSTDWGPTTRAYRDLMDEWKAAPRAAREKDNKLWEEFRAAQDKFFNARGAVNAERDEAEEENYTKKLALVEQAEAILPVKDHKAARAKLRKVLDGWDEIGHVPRAKRPGLEKRLRAVEQKISKSEQEHWKRSDPAAKAFAESTVASFTKAIQKLTKQQAGAEAAGDTKKVADLQAEIDGKQPLLAAAQATLDRYTD
ncbi:MAG: DUF349 domain-containing protein [Actinomycetia bacterium]|nr:DUF349 domain-containing protein [Actinomycetes bacterium]